MSSASPRTGRCRRRLQQWQEVHPLTQCTTSSSCRVAGFTWSSPRCHGMRSGSTAMIMKLWPFDGDLWAIHSSQSTRVAGTYPTLDHTPRLPPPLSLTTHCTSPLSLTTHCAFLPLSLLPHTAPSFPSLSPHAAPTRHTVHAIVRRLAARQRCDSGSHALHAWITHAFRLARLMHSTRSPGAAGAACGNKVASKTSSSMAVCGCPTCHLG